MSLLSELRRRNVIRVATAYLVSFWIVIQITTTVAPALSLPDWISTLVIWLGIVAFPFLMIFAWMYQLTQDGLRRDAGADSALETQSSTATRPLNVLIVALLAISLVFVIVDSYVLEKSLIENAVTPEDTLVASEVLEENSIAVLPFANMSDDEAQGYFSDGLSEELLNLLAKQKGLKVAARTSSFAFKGKQTDIREIGDVLQVAHVLEGSVRRSGNRIRITAQLITSHDGYHLWSETYDRELNDVFAVQDEIAAAIVKALSLHLDIPDFGGARSGNIDAYDLYLRGNELARKPNQAQEAYKLYTQAVELDPGLASAWAAKAELAIILRASQFWDGIPEEEAVKIAQQGIEKALSLDPNLAEAHVAQSTLHYDRYRFEEALASANQAITVNPNLAKAYIARADVLSSMGYLQGAWEAMSMAITLDPLNDVAVIDRWMRAVQVMSPEQITIAERAFNNMKRRYGEDFKLREERVIRAATTMRRSKDYARHYQELDSEGVEFTFEGERFIGVLRLWRFDSPFIDQMRSPLAYRMFLTSWRGHPQDALSQYAELPESLQRVPIVLEERSIAQINAGDCGGALASLDEAHGNSVRIYSQIRPDSLRSNSNLALNRVFCWRKMGKQDEAEALLIRVEEYASRLRNSAFVGFFTVDAKTKVLRGDTEGAMDALELAWNRFDMEFQVFADPVLSTLRGQPRFEQLRQTMTDHVNSERAKLGWSEATL
jgi:TolB-like protein